MDWYLDSLKNDITFCFSFNELMQFFIVNPITYLEEKKIKNYNNITKNNFCDIIKENKNFLNFNGEILSCQVSYEN